MHKYTKEEIINSARLAYKKSGGMLSRKDFIRIAGIPEWYIDNLFPTGGWSELCDHANIDDQSKQLKQKTARRLTLRKSTIGKSSFLRI